MSKPIYTSVKVEPGTRLEQLCAQYDALEHAAKEAETRFETLKTAIKAELANAAPSAAAISAAAPGLALEMTWGETWRLDAKAMKAEDPATYVKWARKSGSWTLRRGKS